MRMAYMNLRNHRKILTVDGKLAFTGSTNISDTHVLKLKPKKPYQDIHFRIEGPVVAQIQDTFRTDWHFTTGQLLEGEAWFPTLAEKGVMMARGIADGPDEDFEKCRWTILGALAHAKRSIRIVTPYFVPDMSLISALNVAAMSGIRVDIVLTDDNDLQIVDWASSAILWQVLERGCHVWRTPPPFDHAKLMVVDSGWTLFGSTNWDVRSLRLNFEFNVECYDETFAKKMEAWVDQKIAHAREVTLKQVDSRPLPIKFRDGIARLFAPHL
jgi:cardiolipin synthase